MDLRLTELLRRVFTYLPAQETLRIVGIGTESRGVNHLESTICFEWRGFGCLIDTNGNYKANTYGPVQDSWEVEEIAAALKGLFSDELAIVEPEDKPLRQFYYSLLHKFVELADKNKGMMSQDFRELPEAREILTAMRFVEEYAPKLKKAGG